MRGENRGKIGTTLDKYRAECILKSEHTKA